MMKFENSELQEVYENSISILEEQKNKLDSITRDINQLESFLKSNVFKPYSMKVDFVDIKFKLMFENGRIYYCQSDEVKPLIETKVACRLQFAPYLKRFLIECIKNSQI